MINHGDKALVSMPPEVVDKLNDVINKFVNCGLRKTLKQQNSFHLTTMNYQDFRKILNLQQRINETFAFSEIIKSIKNVGGEKVSIYPKLIKYGTSEYADVALLINSGKWMNLEDGQIRS